MVQLASPGKCGGAVQLMLLVLALVSCICSAFHYQPKPFRAAFKLFDEPPPPPPRSGKGSLRTAEWAKQRGMTPGYGGFWPGDPDAKKYEVKIVSHSRKEEYTLMVPEDRYIYFYFEEEGIELPIINKPRMCRQGCCTICAGKVVEGKAKMDQPLGLLKEMRNDGYILTCVSMPRSDMVIELQDEDEMYVKQWSDGFEGGGTEWGGFLPDDD
ncbi:2Fe-2S ferredoxin-type domain-containing protein [Ochromonadaceae sp. CCMP2298]|nr:2Fe-2S ferredoxin-type domain-containing protein [Ochromonadaceae sp. CCMP2298]